MDSETEIIQDSFTLLKLRSDAEDEAVDYHGDDDEEHDLELEGEEEEFSFMFEAANTAAITAEDAFINGQLKAVFPLFNGDVLFSDELHENLPLRPPVKKVFVETCEDKGQMTSSTLEVEWADGEWSDRKAVEASPEICRKSNSTGFSKIWRFKDLLGRSNSDGRDAFVFLNNSHAAVAVVEKKESAATAKVNGKAKTVKTASLSAHEVYLKSKAKEAERRRTYLPYRPELMGFFTNVNGGLSKNVHPF